MHQLNFLFGTLSLCMMVGASNPTILTINSPDGDTIDCIGIMDQPAFSHPLLKNHKLQEYPTGMTKVENEKVPRQVWHSAGIGCPTGTIPVRRSTDGATFHSKSHPAAVTINKPTEGHMHAVAFVKDQGKFYGTRATLNVWEPHVESEIGDFSLSQIWIASGSYETSDMNTIEAGWTVYPARYHDHQPRFFTYWTRNAYNGTGCYGTHCAGFVHISQKIALEVAIDRTSTYGGTQLDITIQMWKDQVSGHWWLGLGLDVVEPVGYWPAALFTLLSDHATMVHWGGEVLYRNVSDQIMEAHMGSGEFPDKGFRRAAYFCNLHAAKNNMTLLPVENFNLKATNPEYYRIKRHDNKQCGRHFYFGGPGPQRSGIVHGTVTYPLLFLSFLFLLCV